ncbi:MAG: FecR family protein [Devosia sp.]
MRPIAAAALVLAGLAAPALAESNVGVTAAVNQDAKGIVGANVRTISLGDSVVFNQRIQTGGSGLVQVLLADGTTFMVGPNSDLVIDSFVYDPNAGTAQVTASFTKGVLRFIGGQTSKSPNGVTINTPVGTMGIRGAMVDVVLDPPAGTPPHVDMLFGNEVTLAQGQQLLGRLYAAGYSLALGADGSFDVLKTPPGWGSQIQAALAGQPGTTGGAAKGPGDDDAKKIAGNNSGNGVDKNTPGKDGLTKEERDALLYAAAHYDELRNFILNNQHPYGLVGGVLSVSGANFGLPLQNAFDVDGEDGDGDPNPIFAQFAFNGDNQPVAVKATMGFLGDTCWWLGGCLVYEGGGNGGTLTFVPNEGSAPPPLPVDGYLFNHDDPREDNPMHSVPDPEGAPELTLADQLDCQSCDDFIRWGFWGFSAEDVQVGSVTGDIAYDAMWVNGDLTTAAQLDGLEAGATAIATYTGDAVGNVNNNGSTYVATGDMNMTWDFGNRQGTLNINNFDAEHLNDSYGVNVGGQVISFAGQTGFGGIVYGDGNWGIAQGAFVNNGSDTAAGVIGNFGFGNGYDYTASGVFMGERGATPPP